PQQPVMAAPDYARPLNLTHLEPCGPAGPCRPGDALCGQDEVSPLCENSFVFHTSLYAGSVAQPALHDGELGLVEAFGQGGGDLCGGARGECQLGAAEFGEVY